MMSISELTSKYSKTQTYEPFESMVPWSRSDGHVNTMVELSDLICLCARHNMKNIILRKKYDIYIQRYFSAHCATTYREANLASRYDRQREAHFA
jgi:hypothetical protein